MARRCSICAHPDRDEIENDLQTNTTGVRSISAAYGLNAWTIVNHRRRHMTRAYQNVRYGDYDALYDAVVPQIRELRRQRIVDRNTIRSLKRGAPTPTLSVALGMMHFRSIPTEDELRTRRRILSKLLHSDVGGIDDLQADVNWACDVIMGAM